MRLQGTRTPRLGTLMIRTTALPRCVLATAPEPDRRMLTRFAKRHGWWAVAFGVGMTLFIGFRPWSSEGPLLTSPLQWVVTFVALLLSQLGTGPWWTRRWARS